MYINEAHFECHDILILGKSPIKWRQRPDMTIAVDLDGRPNFPEIADKSFYFTCTNVVR